MWIFRLVLVAACLLTVPGLDARAAEGQPVVANQQEVRYVPLQPAFVVNVGRSAKGRLKFVKADVSLRVTSSEAASAVRYHTPALRNALVLLLSRQDEGTVSTGSGREAVRAQALAALRGILETEEGEGYIDDVLFTNFLVQR